MRRRACLIAAIAGICLTSGGCADGAKIVQQHDGGGIAIYPFKDGQGPMLSAFRNEALDLMKEACRDRSYRIMREGETKGRNRVVSPLDGTQEVIHERRWGIQFECQ